jgi:predicted nucleic-acid-binding Zn-ribbon protein
MKCPKCKSNSISIAEKVIRVTDLQNSNTTLFDNVLLYAVCNDCKFKAFGKDAIKMFRLELTKLEEFGGWGITDEELNNFISMLHVSYEKAISKGKEVSDVGDMWISYQTDVSDFCISEVVPTDVEAIIDIINSGCMPDVVQLELELDDDDYDTDRDYFEWEEED